MNKRTVAYSAVLLLALIVVSVLQNRGLIQGVIRNEDIGLELFDPATGSTLPTGTEFVQNKTITLKGTLSVADLEEVFIHQVSLVVVGLDSLDVALPLVEVTARDLIGALGAAGRSLSATVSFTDGPGAAWGHAAWHHLAWHHLAP